MAFDGIVTAAAVSEISKAVTGGRIDRVYQPSSEEIILLIRNNGEKHRLYISAAANHACIYLTEGKDTNPMNPPSFCMLLRKHLQSARIREVKQVDSERIVEIYTDAVNELGFSVNHRLVIEIMGRHSNVSLVDMRTGKIIDSIKRLSGDVNRYRQTLPGVEYVAPPSHGKVPYCDLSRSSFRKIIDEDKHRDPEKALVSGIQGISPVAAAELVFRAERSSGSLSADSLYDALMEMVDQVSSGSASPAVYFSSDGTPVDFHAVDLTMYDGLYERRPTESISRACREYFEGRMTSNRIHQKSSDIRRIVNAALSKLQLKKQRLNEDLMRAEDSDKYRLYGELLTASLHTIGEGRQFAVVDNYYDGTTLTIPLDPRYSPAKNAQRYFKKYDKARTALVEKQKQLDETGREIEYLESVLSFTEDASTSEDLDEIRAELAENGYMKPKKDQKHRRRSKTKIHPYEYTLSSGLKVMAGRNNRENDQLTFKQASAGDIWMHTKDIPGSHVIIFTGGRRLTADEIYEAASIAAYHSKASQSANVPVDYVNARYVKKPAGARPGYVIFTHNRTVYVDPKLPGHDATESSAD
ncbi:MAG: NFACT RNA binding domain-containing protein [Eubacteriales bacterium]|nr:NFACT RNA binding domain-containing protein [Eubacteriales bacterium]